MKITIEVDDEEVRRVLAPLIQQAQPPQSEVPTKLLKVDEVADRLGVSRNTVYELLYKRRDPVTNHRSNETGFAFSSR